MNRQHDGGKAYPASGQPSAAVPFIHRLTASAAFKDLFGQGMTLVQEAAAYLDGPGRKESQDLAGAAALAYGRESMRLTTRLMQVASWLLLQRAVNEGELTPVQALAERHRVRLTPEPLELRSRDLRAVAGDVTAFEPALVSPSGARDSSRPQSRHRPLAGGDPAAVRDRLATRAPARRVRNAQSAPLSASHR